MPSTLIFGCGYLGQRVGRLLVARGDRVLGTTRSPARGDELRGDGIEPLVVDVTDPATLGDLPAVDRVLYCVGFDRRAGHSIGRVYVDGFRAVVDALGRQPSPCPIVYVSSTGVYGGDDGGWVDEESPVDPPTESGAACRDAEQLLADHATRRGGAIVLRYAGLYGPGRIMRQESLRRGDPVVGAAGKYLNFVQIDDAAAVAVRALDGVTPGGLDLFLVSDGHPVTRAEFYGAVAEYLGAPPPRFEPPAPGSPEAKREGSNKRISNRKLIERWGTILRYPDIRSGLAASLAGDPAPLANPERP